MSKKIYSLIKQNDINKSYIIITDCIRTFKLYKDKILELIDKLKEKCINIKNSLYNYYIYLNINLNNKIIYKLEISNIEYDFIYNIYKTNTYDILFDIANTNTDNMHRIMYIELELERNIL
jgi:hypothetical protein